MEVNLVSGKDRSGPPAQPMAKLDCDSGTDAVFRFTWLAKVCLCGFWMGLVSLWGAAASEVASPAEAADESLWIRHLGWEGLKQGSFGDSGANTYVSRRGRVQTINRWDLNGDGELDLVFTQDHNSVYTPDSLIYWGTPTGFQSLLPELSEWRAGFSVWDWVMKASRNITRLPSMGGGRGQIADLDGDGFSDIILCNFMHNYRPDQQVYIYWGSAHGFDVDQRTELPAYLAGGVAVGDLNSDGLLDLVIANHGDELGERRGFRFHLESFIYWGDLHRFDTGRRSSVATISASDAEIGDFNGDGSPDLAFVNYNSQEKSVYVYWGDGSGEFPKQKRQILTSSDLRLDAEDKTGRPIPGMRTLKTHDLDRDRFDDLIVAGTRKAVIYRGSKQGLKVGQASELPANNCGEVEVADLNADGKLDLIVANEGPYHETPPSSIFWGTSDGFDADHRSDLPTLSASTVKTVDFNQDGFLDLLFGNGHDAKSRDVPSYIYWGNSRGNYSPHRRQELSAFSVADSDVADLNHDGRLDLLLISHLSGHGNVLPTAIFWGNAEARYSTAGLTLLEPGANMEYSIADLDDDDYPDLVLLNRESYWVWWGSKEGYSADRRTRLPGELPIASNVADLNRDGFLDVLLSLRGDKAAGKQAKAMIVWGNADRFRDARSQQFDLDCYGLESNAIADLNRDGSLDLIYPNGFSEHSQIFWGSEEEYDPQNVTLMEAYRAPHVLVADMDADGWLELILTNGSTPSFRSVNSKTYVYWGGPNGYSPEARVALEGFTSLDASVADFDRDGYLDLALTNYKSDTTRELPAFVYWGGPDRTLGKRPRTLIPAASSAAVDSLDLNRDGWIDLLVTNHQKHFDHSAAGTNLFWGGPDGFSLQRADNIPTIGVHLDAMVDAGHVYHRRYE